MRFNLPPYFKEKYVMKPLKNLFMATALTAITFSLPVSLVADEHKHEGHAHEGHEGHEHKVVEEHASQAPAHNNAAKKQDNHNHGEKHESHAHEGHEDHGHKPHTDEPHHGGIVGVANDYHHELVMGDARNVSLYVEGLPKAGNALKLVTVRLMILQGKDKQEREMKLSEDDPHRFDATLTTTLATHDKVVALIILNDKDTRIVRFEIPAK
jgi:hypothetical protein